MAEKLLVIMGIWSLLTVGFLGVLVSRKPQDRELEYERDLGKLSPFRAISPHAE